MRPHVLFYVSNHKVGEVECVLFFSFGCGIRGNPQSVIKEIRSYGVNIDDLFFLPNNEFAPEEQGLMQEKFLNGLAN